MKRRIKKDGWFKKLTGLFGGVFPFFALVVVVGYALGNCSTVWEGNEVCDKKCLTKGYPAGEIASPRDWKHDVCVCWPASPSPPAYFLLERDD